MSARRGTIPPPDLRARVLAEVARAPAPTRREHRTRTTAIAAAGVVASAALFFASGGLKPGTRPAELIVFAAGFALFCAIVLTRVAGGLRPSSMLVPPRQVLLGCIAAAPILALAALAAAVLWPEAADHDVQPKTHLACGVLTIAQGALPLLTLLLPRRGSDPVHPAVTGAALGVAAGAWTAAMAYLRCPHPAALHCIVAHVLPMLALAAAGALLGRALLKLR